MNGELRPPTGSVRTLLSLLRTQHLWWHLVPPTACGLMVAIAAIAGREAGSRPDALTLTCAVFLVPASLIVWTYHAAITVRMSSTCVWAAVTRTTVAWSLWACAALLAAVSLSATPGHQESAYCLLLIAVWLAVAGLATALSPFLQRATETTVWPAFSRQALLVVVLAATAYSAYFTWRSFARHSAFQTNLYDLGIMDQAVWNTVHGRWLEETVNLARPVCRATQGHVEIMMLPMALLYCIREDPRWLLWVQSCTLALGALPVFWLARARLGWAIAVAFAFAYLAFPAAQYANLQDFHTLTFATTALLFMIYFLEAERGAPALLFACLALLCREDVTLPVLSAGMLMTLRRPLRTTGFALMVVAGVWAVVSLVALPLAGGHQMWHFFTQPTAHPTDASPAQAASALLKHPVEALCSSGGRHLMRYALEMLLPVGALAVVAPRWILAAAPTLAYYMVSGNEGMTDIRGHYPATIVPFVIAAAVMGAHWIRTHACRWRFTEQVAGSFLVAYVLLAAVTFNRALGPSLLPPDEPPRRQRDALRAVLREIPPGVPLATCHRLGPHVSHRRELYYWRDVVTRRPPIAVQDFTREWAPCLGRPRQPAFALEPPDAPTAKMLRDRDYGVSVARGDVWLFRRGYDYESGLRNLLLQRPPPEAPPPGSVLEASARLPELIAADVVHRYRMRHDIHHLRVNLYWRTPRVPCRAAFSLGLRLGGKTRWLGYEPAFGLWPVHRWPTGEIVMDPLTIHVTNPDRLPSATVLAEVVAEGGAEQFVAEVCETALR